MNMLKYDAKQTTVIITGDWHINLSKNTEWQRDRLLSLCDKIIKSFSGVRNKSTNDDILILNGDIFDSGNPTYQELALFYEVLAYLTDRHEMRIVLLSGNHEERGGESTIFDFIPHNHFRYVKYGTIEIGDYTLHLVGHPFIKNIPNIPLTGKKNLLVSHYRSNLPFANEEVDNVLVSERFSHTILSDIHFKYQPLPNIQYTSAPYSDKFVPIHAEYGFTRLRFYTKKTSLKIESIVLDLPSKYRVDFGLTQTVEEFIASLEHKHLYKIIYKRPYNSVELETLRELPFVDSVKVLSDNQDSTDDSEIVDTLKEKGSVDLIELLLSQLDDDEAELIEDDLKGLVC